MANGYWNRILRVNLTTGETSIDAPGDEFFRQMVGGRAMIAHYLLTEVPPGIDAFDPENRLVFAAGVVTGVALPGAGRHSVGAKSPLTGGFGEAEAGGFWGAELKHAGFDGIVVHGRAKKPVYLTVTDAGAEIRDASHLWGKLTDEVEDRIREELGDKLIRVAQCGVAGERLVRYACVVNDLNEVAGRTGLGAVMGSKNLKAIAVRGTKKVPVADSKPLTATARWVATTLMENHRNFHEFGTGAAMIGKQLEGHLVVRNFREGQFINAEDVRLIDAVAIRDQYRVKMDACFACSVRCKKRVKLEKSKDGYDVDPKFGGPEYETLGAIGTNLDVHDLVALCKANEKLNYLGLDAVSAGCTIAWAIECYELGLLTDADTDGTKLEWGDGKLLVDILDKIAYREGQFGELLGEGALRAARAIGRGTEQYVVHVKGMEIAMHDPRAMPHMKENYPVNPTGGDHTGGAKHRTSLRNTAGVCQFLQYDEPRMVEIINAVTGWGVTLEELEQLTDRGLTMTRLFNMREGITRADDRLPDRLHEPLRRGPLQDKVLTREEIDEWVTTYYLERGWDARTGRPLPETLQKLGLVDQRYATTVS